MTEVLLGIASGIAFGFVIQRVGATNADRMARAHLMIDPDIPRFMLAAIALSALGLVGLQSQGMGRTLILPTSLVATAAAAVIFGIGWGLAGYCPGTAWAAAGEGRLDAVFAVLGGLAGTALFAQLHGVLIPLLYAPTNVGRITLSGWLGSRPLAALLFAVVLGGVIYLIGRLWGHGRRCG